MRKIKVANVSFLSAIPFRGLTDHEFFPEAASIEYEENLPTENARKLSEGEVDMALVSPCDFALHGGYVGMDFGVSVWERSDNVFLYAHQPIDRLHSIHLYPGAGASSYLLRLLCREHWNVTPRFIRTWQTSHPLRIAEHEGLLVRHRVPYLSKPDYPICEDIAEVWHELTGKPFVFLIWAIRPGTLTATEHQCFQDFFHKARRAVAPIAENHAASFNMSAERCADFILGHYQYYLDEPNLEGMEEFLLRGARSHLLPEAHYQSASVKLLSRGTISAVPERTIPALLEDAASGIRLGVKDTVRIAEHATLSELSTAADLMRRRAYPTRMLSHVVSVDVRSLQTAEQEVRARIEAASALGIRQVLIQKLAICDLSLEFFERWLHILKSDYLMSVEALCISDIVLLARQAQKPVHEVVSRLITAGLDVVSGADGGMLLDRVNSNAVLRAHEWQETARAINRFGGRTTCCIALEKEHTWEQRVLHLQKLRLLQDELPGFRAFFCHQPGAGVLQEVKLRAQMVARLFLDNIPSIQEVAVSTDNLSSVLGLSFGVNEIRVEMEGTNSARVSDMLHAVKMLQDLGMDFDSARVPDGNDQAMH